MDISILSSNTGHVFTVKRLLSVRHTFTPANMVNESYWGSRRRSDIDNYSGMRA